MTGIHQLLLSNFTTGGTGGVVIVETFLGDSIWNCPTGVTSIDYLVVAGGGGGGNNGGGGGAGGFRTGTGLSVTAGTDYSITVDKPSLFGNATFTTGSYVFGAASDPITRQVVEGSGHSNYFRVFSDDTKDPYTVNGLYIDYVPSGRQ